MTTTQELILNQVLWVSNRGDVTCEKHAGVYLTLAIKERPKAKSHTTPLGNYIKATYQDTGGLPCEMCVDWSTMEFKS